MVFFSHPTDNSVLLLRRAATKSTWPNLITGIGGKVELKDGEGIDMVKSLWREVKEETMITPNIVDHLKIRLTTILTRDYGHVVLIWCTGRLKVLPSSLSCTEGDLFFTSPDQLPESEMIPTACQALKFLLALDDKDDRIYNGIFVLESEIKLIVNK